MNRIPDQETDRYKKIFVPLKLLTVVCLSLLDHVDEVIRQDERHALPVDPEFPLEVAQEVPEVNVEQLRSKGENAFWVMNGFRITERSHIS